LTFLVRGKKIGKFGNWVPTSRSKIFCKNKGKLMIVVANSYRGSPFSHCYARW